MQNYTNFQDSPPKKNAIFVSPHVELYKFDDAIITQLIECCARVCYKSEDKITPGSADKLVSRLVSSGHDAMIEFSDIIVKFFTDRGISHEIVRHRECSFAQESTRYVKYKEPLKIVAPILPEDMSIPTQKYLLGRMLDEASEAKNLYDLLLGEYNLSPQVGRDVLPTFAKTEIVVKANVREWRHIFRLRCAPDAHPKIRQVMIPLLIKFAEMAPILFKDILDEVVMPSFELATVQYNEYFYDFSKTTQDFSVLHV